MKILVTGAAGHFGSVLVGRLLEGGETVVGLDALLYGAEGLAGVWAHPRFSFVKADIREPLPVAVRGVNAVVHLAALVGPVCERDPREAWRVNYDAVARVCRWVERHRGVRLVFASTCSNYGRFGGLATEQAPLNPLGTYALTKVAAEHLVQQLDRRAVTFRFATLAGISPRPRFDTLLNQLTREGLQEGRIECRQPRARRPFLHVRDAAEAVARVLGRWALRREGCYNVVGFNTTIAALGREVRRQTGCAVSMTQPSADGRDYAVSGARLAKAFGVHPAHGLRACVGEVREALQHGVVRPRQEHSNMSAPRGAAPARERALVTAG